MEVWMVRMFVSGVATPVSLGYEKAASAGRGSPSPALVLYPMRTHQDAAMRRINRAFITGSRNTERKERVKGAGTERRRHRVEVKF